MSFYSSQNKFQFFSHVYLVICKYFRFGPVQNFVVCLRVNFLPNNKIVAWSKLKAFADKKSIVAKMMISLFDREENMVGKGENVGQQHFLLFPQFSKTLLPQGR